MDCSLATWPSIVKFDDFSWTKLGDIDPLENLDRMLDQDRLLNVISHEKRPLLTPSSIPRASDSNVESADLFCLSPYAPLVAGRWESINALDLSSFMDSTFPPMDDTSNSNALDGFDLCHTENLIQHVAEQERVAVPMSELAEVNTVTVGSNEVSPTATLLTGGSSSFSNSGEDVKLAGYDGSLASISGTRMDEPALTDGCCEAEMVSNGKKPDATGGQSLNSLQSSLRTLPGCANPCNPKKSAMGVTDMVLSPQNNYAASDSTLPSPQPHSRSMVIPKEHGEKAVHHWFPVQPTTLERQLELVDAVRVRSELKCSRAEASRARRRAASQRRARKYPLQKLIRMSSSPYSTRDKIDQRSGMMQPQLLMQSPAQFPSEGHTLQNKTQMPSFVPIVFQGPQSPLSQKVLPHTNSLQGGPFVCYREQLSMAPDEDNCLSSGSSAMRPMCMEQDMSTVPLLPPSHTTTSIATTSMKPLDAALLEQLQSVLSKMSVEMRLCIRDAFYRLARNVRQRQSNNQVASGSDETSCQSEAMETHTNSIDRWIVNILFCKQQPIMEASNTTSFPQQWNSYGSFNNLQEIPLPAMSGS